MDLIATLKIMNVEEIRIAYQREMSKRSLYYFFKLIITEIYRHIEFTDNWHYQYLCDILQVRVESMLRHEPQKHLLINCPIRSGKTILISEIFPVWLWIKSDKLMIQNVCATQRLATKSSRMSKLILTSQFFQQLFPEIQLAHDAKAKSDYVTTNNGSRQSYGVDSSIIGSSYSVLIADDLNDPADVNSEISLNNVITTFKDVISGRMNNQWDMRVILQQRTSSKDLCQHLMDNNREDYRHICITGELTKDTSNEVRQYYKDDLFFPSRYSRERLEQYKRELTPQAYASQILQSPASLQGEIILRIWLSIKKQSEVQAIPKGKIYLFIDSAFTSNDKNDASAYFVCFVNNGKMYILKCYEKWLEFFESIEEIKELIVSYGVNKVYVENKATGLSIMQELKRQLRGKTVILPVSPGSKSKIERARSIQTYLQNGKVCVVQDTWNNTFIDQCANFPYGKNNMVDCLVYAVGTLIAGKHATENPVDNKRGMFGDDDFDLY